MNINALGKNWDGNLLLLPGTHEITVEFLERILFDAPTPWRGLVGIIKDALDVQAGHYYQIRPNINRAAALESFKDALGAGEVAGKITFIVTWDPYIEDVTDRYLLPFDRENTQEPISLEGPRGVTRVSGVIGPYNRKKREFEKHHHVNSEVTGSTSGTWDGKDKKRKKLKPGLYRACVAVDQFDVIGIVEAFRLGDVLESFPQTLIWRKLKEVKIGRKYIRSRSSRHCGYYIDLE